ncbi:hypothetical protein NP284_29485 [Rhodopseudomonas pseudopalustris]|jgi:hypothetical protein|uniref:hypothetical protein n=1 Tax=Rhodopseudomonas pseudopalustris TaxID=1513892 RepID=UPI003F972C20
MTLRDEIAALREEVAKLSQQQQLQQQAASAAPPPPPPPSNDQAAAGEDQPTRIGPEELIAAANSVIEELQQDIDKYPRLTAIAAFGLGLAVGIFAGRQSR